MNSAGSFTHGNRLIGRFLLILSLLLVCALTVFYISQYPYYVPYSLKPDPSSQEWKELEEFERRMLADIPEDILTRQKTNVLIQSVLNNPYINIHAAYWPDNYARGYESIKDKCNGLGELETRSDASVELLNTYSRMQVTDTGDRFLKTAKAWKHWNSFSRRTSIWKIVPVGASQSESDRAGEI